MTITHTTIKFLMKPSIGHVDCRPELQTTDLPHEDGRKASRDARIQEEVYFSPRHGLALPSHPWAQGFHSCQSYQGPGFNQLLLSQGRQVTLRKRRQRLQTLCRWRKGPWGIPQHVGVSGTAAHCWLGCLDYRWWRFGVGVVLSCWENFRSKYLSWSAMQED